MKPSCGNCYHQRDYTGNDEKKCCARYSNLTSCLKSFCGEWWPRDLDLNTLLHLKKDHEFLYYKIKRAIKEGD